MEKRQLKLGLGKKIVFSLATIVIFFLVLEAGTRIWYACRHHNSYWLLFGTVHTKNEYKKIKENQKQNQKQNQEYGINQAKLIKRIQHDGYWVFDPGIHPMKVQGLPPMSAKINYLGLRGDEVAVKKKTGVKRIILLGESAVFGLSLEDKNTLPSLLNNLLNKDSYAGKFEVINAGILGAQSDNLLALFKAELLQLEPDFLIAYFGFNDHSAQIEERHRTVARNIYLYLHKLLYYRSLLFTVAVEKASLVLTGRANPLLTVKYKVSSKSGYILNKVSHFKNNLSKLNNLCKEHNIKFIIAKQPLYFPANYPPLGDESFMEKLSAKDKSGLGMSNTEYMYLVQSYFFKAEDELAKSYGIPEIDCTRPFNNISGDKMRYFFDVVHLKPEGSRLVAEAMYSYFKGTP